MRQGTMILRAAMLVGVLTPFGANAQPIELHAEGRIYLLEATAASYAQAEVARLAAQEAEDEAVREFAEGLLEDYTERSEALSGLAEEHGVEPVAALDPVSERRLEALRGLSGPAFDAEYVAGQVPALYGEGWVHRRAVEQAAEAPIREAAQAAVAPTEANYDTALALALEREGELPDGLHPWDSAALVFGMSIDRAQVALGELVLARSDDERARSFAERMVEEHSRSFDASAALAEEHGVAPVEEPGPVETRVLERLSQLSGEELAREYLDSQVIFHDHWYKRLEFAGNNGRNEAVTALGVRGRDMGKAHHDAVYGIVQDLGG